MVIGTDGFGKLREIILLFSYFGTFDLFLKQSKEIVGLTRSFEVLANLIQYYQQNFGSYINF
jgi:hypothetical protein